MTRYTPWPFPVSGSPPFLVAYWADVDTTPHNGGAIYYRATTNQALLDRASVHITGLFTQARQTFEATQLFIATWSRVGYYEEHTDLVAIIMECACLYKHAPCGKHKLHQPIFPCMQTNTFQVVLITDGSCSFVTYFYADRRIQWTTGDASGGEGGLGGTPAQAGFDAGDGMRFFSIPGSQTPAIVDIETTTNVSIPGQWTFRVDLDNIVEPCMFCSQYLQDFPPLTVVKHV